VLHLQVFLEVLEGLGVLVDRAAPFQDKEMQLLAFLKYTVLSMTFFTKYNKYNYYIYLNYRKSV
jgi:hypothetical protein